MRSESKAMAVVLLLTILCTSGCGKRTTSSDIPIGVAVCLTGDVAPFGQKTIRGIRLACDEINSKGGVRGKKLRLLVEDTQSEPRVAVLAITKLIEVDKVSVVIGDVLSSTTLAMAPIAEQNHIILFAPGASNPSVRNAGDYVFRNWVSDDFDGTAMAQYIYGAGLHTLATLTQQNDYCVGLTKALVGEYTQIGGRIVSQQVFQTGALDMRVQIEKIRSAQPTAVYVSGEARGDGLALKQMAEIAYRARVFSNVSLEMSEARTIAGKAIEGVTYSTPAYDSTSTDSLVVGFVNRYKRANGEAPDVTAAIAYDAMNIIAAAIRAVGTQPDSIKSFLYSLKDFPGVSGSTSFDDHGDVHKDIFIRRFTASGSVLLKRFTVSGP